MRDKHFDKINPPESFPVEWLRAAAGKKFEDIDLM